MAQPKPPEEGRRRSKPATTPEEREAELVSASFDLAEKQIRAGTASSQVITHFIKLGSSREKLEQERLRHENELTQVKIEALEKAERMEDLFEHAIRAMTQYQGGTVQEDDASVED